MQLRNIRPHSQYLPGDVVEVPDGAAFDPFCWELTPEQEAKTRAALDASGPHVPFPIEDAAATAVTPATAPVQSPPDSPKEM
jgi:hypothetical protein